MTIEKAVLELCKETIDDRNDWYSWRPIDETLLPTGISLPAGNKYKKNVALKLALNREWRAAEDKRKLEIIDYYISTWGDIESNAIKTLRLYSNAKPEDLIRRGREGVASWSKALCIYNPYEYAIFDARVSAALNALHILSATCSPTLFPILHGKNDIIEEATSRLQNMAAQNNWSFIADNIFYRRYLQLLKEIKFQLNIPGVEIYTIEMLLFSKAPELVNKAFLENRSGVIPILCTPSIDVNACSNSSSKAPMDKPSVWKEKTGPCPKCGYPEVVARESTKTGELYFGCNRPKQGTNKDCNFKGCRSH